MLKELLIDEMRDLLHVENQLVSALPKMAQAAHNPKLREAFEKHLEQTRQQADRLKQCIQLLGGEAQPKSCKSIMGLVEDSNQRIQECQGKDAMAADLALINAAQKVEHYEIAGYGTLRELAREIGQYEVAALLGRTLGEEESADYQLTSVAKPILQQAVITERGAKTDLGPVYDLREMATSARSR